MNYHQLHITHFSSDPETLSDQLTELGALAVTFEAADSEEIFEPDLNVTTLWQHTKLTALFANEKDLQTALTTLQNNDPALQYHLESVAEQNWQRNCMDQFQPLQFGNRTWICPSWHVPPNPLAVNILLDPGLAFGTGTHPTTALCLEWLDSADLKNMTVIDYGCGSGILAIAALLHGAKHVFAIDHDPQALQATRDNAKRNVIGNHQLTIIAPDAAAQPKKHDTEIVLANILAEPLIKLAPTFANYLIPGGQLVLSGILTEQSANIVNAYQFAFNNFAITERDGWIRIVAQRI